jgi:hypothetical protein
MDWTRSKGAQWYLVVGGNGGGGKHAGLDKCVCGKRASRGIGIELAHGVEPLLVLWRAERRKHARRAPVLKIDS